MSGIITEPKFLETFPQMDQKNKSGAIQALVVAIYEIGCLTGSLLIVAVGDKLGRRRAVLLGTSIMFVGAALQAASFGIAQLIVGRIVTGVGNGMNTSTSKHDKTQARKLQLLTDSSPRLAIGNGASENPRIPGIVRGSSNYRWSFYIVLAELWLLVCHSVWFATVAVSVVAFASVAAFLLIAS